jgi:Ca2+-binding RTX toxin-like protein
MSLFASHPLSNYSQFEYTPPNKGLTGNRQIDALISGYRWTEKNSAGQTVISYSFVNPESSFVSNYSSFNEPVSRSYFSEEVRALTRTVLNQIAEVCNLNFVEVNDNNQESGVLRYSFSQVVANNQAAAWAYSPSSSPRAGDVWLNPEYADKQVASWGYTLANILLHETLHALGLRHPFETSDNYKTTLNSSEDIQANTVMSYTPSLNSTRQWLSHWPQEPMVFDVQALQLLYGPSQHQINNTRYDLSDSSFIGQLRTLWDSAGKDTLDASGLSKGVTLDMRPGQASDIGQNVLSSALPYTQTLYLAIGTWIEDAIGTVHNDTVISNDADNSIATLDGDDVIHGSLGTDRIDGGNGNDTLVWSISIDQFVARFLSDQLFLMTPNGHTQTIRNIEQFRFDNQNYVLAQLVNSPTGRLTWFNDVIKFNGNSTAKVSRQSEWVYRIADLGANYDIQLHKSLNGLYVERVSFTNIQLSSTTELHLQESLNSLSIIQNLLEKGTLQAFWSHLLSSHDTITLSSLADQINSGPGDDWLFGMAGNDILDGGAGNDLLDGGSGDDQLIGGTGNDRFVIDSVRDRVKDVAGHDVIETSLTAFNLSSHKSIEDLEYRGTLNAQLIGNALSNRITAGPGDDLLDGGAGSDVLTGGAGFDIFRLSSPLKNNVDTVTDFVSGIDRLMLSSKILSKLKNLTTLDNHFAIDQSIDKDDFLIFKPSDQTLYYDADGSNLGKTPIAIFTGISSLQIQDLLIY